MLPATGVAPLWLPASVSSTDSWHFSSGSASVGPVRLAPLDMWRCENGTVLGLFCALVSLSHHFSLDLEYFHLWKNHSYAQPLAKPIVEHKLANRHHPNMCGKLQLSGPCRTDPPGKINTLRIYRRDMKLPTTGIGVGSPSSPPVLPSSVG